jgi:GT2 family glycosyltransferase
VNTSFDSWAIVVTDRPLFPALSGNRLRILGILRALRELGRRVALVCVAETGPHDRLVRLADQVVFVPAPGFSGGSLEQFDPTPFRHAVDRVAAAVRPDVAIAEYAWLAPALVALPRSTRRIVDCHDILSERTARFSAAGLDGWAVCSWEQEARRLACADVVVACQERETALLRERLPGKRVECVLTPVDLPPGFVPAPSRGHIVLTVGANHPGNDAVFAFARDAWPRVLAGVPGARLHVVGGIGSRMEPSRGVKILGNVASVHPHYAAAAAVVCPVTVGTGVKTKLLEALRYGKATVVTTEGAEGMPVPQRPAWITSASLAGCADALAVLLVNAPARAALEAEAFAFGERHLAALPFREGLRSLLSGPLAEQVSVRWPDAAAAAPAATAHEHDLPSVSIVVPHAGSGRGLRRCLRSLLGQRYPRSLVEIVVVVPAAGYDVYAEVTAEFAGVRLLWDRKPGAAAARNAGATAASGAFIAFLDGDCRVSPDWLAHMVSAAVANPDSAVSVGVIESARPGPDASAVDWYEARVLHRHRRAARADRCGAGAVLLARELWDRIGRFDEGFTEASYEGEEWSARAVAYGARLVLVSRACAMHATDGRWGALRRRVRALARGDRYRGTAVAVPQSRYRRELIQVFRDARLPWHVRPQVAVVALCAWYWAATEHRLPFPAPAWTTEGPLPQIYALPDSVSVVVPSLGWPDSLANCLRSLRAQTVDLPVEIIVVVNGPDASAADRTQPGVAVLYEARPGPAAARNTGARAATGDVLAFIDSDCVADPAWLASAVTMLRTEARDSVVAGAISRSNARRNWVSRYDSLVFLKQEDYVTNGAGCVTANVVVHRSVFERIGPFNERFTEAAGEDSEWAMRAQRAGIRIRYGRGAIVDHPCMERPIDLARKARRLARGDLLMQRVTGQAIAAPSLRYALYRRWYPAVKTRRIGVVDRLCLITLGAAVAVWEWRALRRQLRDEGQQV